jgi:hypothetical protein
MLINNKHGTFVILEDKIFHIENNHIFDTGPISEEDKKEFKSTDYYVIFEKNGKLHRNNDLPAVIYVNGSKSWYQNGIFIRREYANQK